MSEAGLWNNWNSIAALLVILCWPVYLALFFKPAGSRPGRTDRSSMAGILMQFAGALILLAWRQPVRSGSAASAAASVIAVVLAVWSVWFSYLALRALGKQWSLVAGITSEHELVRHGPYAVVRHPLYTSFFTLALATAIVWTDRSAVLAAMAIVSAGIWIRIRIEERLLRETFGAEFDAYARRVPAFLGTPKPSPSGGGRPRSGG